jgi:hypothetical protein
LTHTDRPADWQKMTPEWQRRVRTNMLAVLERLEHMSRHAQSGDSTPASQCAQKVRDWLNFGDFRDARTRLVALLDLAQAEQLLTLRMARPSASSETFD